METTTGTSAGPITALQVSDVANEGAPGVFEMVASEVRHGEKHRKCTAAGKRMAEQVRQRQGRR